MAEIPKLSDGEIGKVKILNRVFRVIIIGSMVAAVIGLAFIWLFYQP